MHTWVVQPPPSLMPCAAAAMPSSTVHTAGTCMLMLKVCCFGSADTAAIHGGSAGQAAAVGGDLRFPWSFFHLLTCASDQQTVSVCMRHGVLNLPGCMQAMLKAQRPPSKGGPDIPVPDTAGSSPFQGTAGPFQQSFQQQPPQPAAATLGQQQPAPPFGQVQQPAAPAAAFGQGAAASRIVFGQAARPAAAFGSSAASAPGFNSGLAANPFGSMPTSTPFGSTAAAVPARFGAPAASPPNAFGFGGGAAAPAPAQQQHGSFGFAGSNTAPTAGQAATPASMQPGSLGSGPGFGQSMMAAAVPTQPLPNGHSPPKGWVSRNASVSK
jgi:hypothetical protein